jgi:hypothetical protein
MQPTGLVAGTGRTPAPWVGPAWSGTPLGVMSGQTPPAAARHQQVAGGSGHHLLGHRCRWGDPRGQAHTQADEEAPAARTTFGMGIASLTAGRLPVQDHRLCHRLLPQLGPTAGQGRPLGRRIPSVGTDDPSARGRHRHEIPPDTLVDGHAPAALGRGLLPGPLPVEPIAARHHALLTRDSPLVGEGPTTEGAGHRGEHPGAMGIPLPDVHVPLLTPTLMAQRDPVPQGHPIGPREGPLVDSAIECRQPLAPTHRQHHPHRQQKPVADRPPLPLVRHPATGDQTVEMGVSHQRLAPGMPRGAEPRPGAEICGSAPQFRQRPPHRRTQQLGHHLDMHQP